jgi:hypothetical protein
MRFNQSDIVEDMLAHIRELGGDISEWCVGTARDREGEFFRRHAAADLDNGLIWREAYTPYAAAEVAERLADSGLRLDRGSVPTPGYIVFVYRPNAAAPRVAQTSAVMSASPFHVHTEKMVP